MRYRRLITPVRPSRNLVSRVEIIESMPRVARPTPTPTRPAGTAPRGETAPVSVSPLATPDPNPSRALAVYVEPQNPLEFLPCFIPGPLGAGAVLDLSCAFVEFGSWCPAGSGHEIACALGWVASKLPPRPGAESWPVGLEAAERKATRVRAGASWAHREVESTRILVYNVLNFLLPHHLLLQSEHCIMLHGASERGASEGGGGQRGKGVEVAEMDGSATSPAIADNSSFSSSGAPLVGGSPSMVGGISAAGAKQQPALSTAAGVKGVNQGNRELLGLTTKTCPPEVRG